MLDQALQSIQLSYVATGKATEDLANSVNRLRQFGDHFTGKPTSRPTVTSVSGNTATVHDCFGGPDWRPVYSLGPNKDKYAGAPGTTVTTHPITVTLTQFQGTWLVTDAVTGSETC